MKKFVVALVAAVALAGCPKEAAPAVVPAPAADAADVAVEPVVEVPAEGTSTTVTPDFEVEVVPTVR
jgi:PBP1b-binding outer membrane lipoprotein LpoB